MLAIDPDDPAATAGRPAGWSLLDVRWHVGGPPGIAAYDADILPGAVFVDLDRDLAGPPGPDGRPSPLPSPEVFQEAMRRAGVRNDRAIVIYDDADSTAAARPGGFCGTSGTSVSGCSTVATGPGWRPGCR